MLSRTGCGHQEIAPDVRRVLYGAHVLGGNALLLLAHEVGVQVRLRLGSGLLALVHDVEGVEGPCIRGRCRMRQTRPPAVAAVVHQRDRLQDGAPVVALAASVHDARYGTAGRYLTAPSLNASRPPMDPRSLSRPCRAFGPRPARAATGRARPCGGEPRSPRPVAPPHRMRPGLRERRQPQWMLRVRAQQAIRTHRVRFFGCQNRVKLFRPSMRFVTTVFRRDTRPSAFRPFRRKAARRAQSAARRSRRTPRAPAEAPSRPVRP